MKKINAHVLSSYVWIIFRTVLFAGLAFIIIQPLLIKLSTSFKNVTDLYDASVFLIPKNFTLYNYQRIISFFNYPARFMNSVMFGAACSMLQIMSCTMVAYGISRFKFRGRGLILGMAVFTMVIPPQATLLSLFLQFKFFGPVTIFTLGTTLKGADLIGSPLPMILLSVFAVGFKNGLYIFMMRQYFKNLPKELEEAAYIDGCGKFRTFITIMLPGALSMLGAIFLFAFVWQWNDYYYTMTLTPGMNIFTTILPRIGDVIAFSDGILVGNMQNMLYDSAAMIMHIVPLLILYLFTQKIFVQSIERSGLVG
ncbi:carbohydrate ABC transporter permease [Candidatus Nomurabacteria bacterium]|nr:carbohydrate ABC transporter permease [Candidatus Nomurabacteria bacterium]